MDLTIETKIELVKIEMEAIAEDIRAIEQAIENLQKRESNDKI